MSTFLLAWNPNRWVWHGFDDLVNSVQAGEDVVEDWSCGNNRSIAVGDRVFLIRLGENPRGIIASGDVVRGSYQGAHWDPELATAGRQANFVDVRIEWIVDPEKERIISRDELDSSEFAGMHWDTQISGISIPDDIAQVLEQRWALVRFIGEFNIPEEIDLTEQMPEGASRKVTINAYERSSKARKKCIDHHGSVCSVCGFDFLSTYGEVAEGFIHVHHLVPISDIGEAYEVDPIADLRPVCPNCHAVIHLRRPPYEIDDAKRFLQSAGSS